MKWLKKLLGRPQYIDIPIYNGEPNTLENFNKILQYNWNRWTLFTKWHWEELGRVSDKIEWNWPNSG